MTSPTRVSPFAVRGVLEGFYGNPWTHQARMNQLAFYGDVKLNTYVYSPKDDPYLRDRWRDPYPPDKLAEVQQLIQQAQAHHVRFTYALSPGGCRRRSPPCGPGSGSGMAPAWACVGGRRA